MSDHSTVTAADPVAPAPLFDRGEISQFGADDTEAVSTIGKMLTGFFLYSLLAMGAVVLVTVATRHNEPPPAHSADADE